MLAIKHNIPEIKNKLERMRKLLGGKPNWQDDVVDTMKQARDTVERLTPRSSQIGSQRGGAHMADGWTLKVIGGDGKDRVPLLAAVYNRFTHNVVGEKKGGALLKTAKGHKKDYTLLEILEYGSPPHRVKPVNKKALRFEIGGKEVFTKNVHHPGTKPYGMVRKTRAKLAGLLKKLARKWDRKIKTEWERG